MPPKYQKKDHLSHILLRPDTYVGSTRLRKSAEFIYKDGKIQKEIISMSPGLLRVFVEILSNAIDNCMRSEKTKTPCKSIKVSIEDDIISIWNDGEVIPIEMHEEEKCYNHSLIFGQLLTGSNYDDEKERTESGRNGYGSKLTNAFSEEFTVEGCDPTNMKHLTQTWTNNMKNTDGPLVKASKLKKGYTKVTWKLDFSRFGLKDGYTEDIIKLYTKYVMDTAMLCSCDVYLNGEILKCASLQEYASLYSDTEEKLYIKTKNCSVLLTPSSTGFQHISFVNGVYTKLGGIHVEEWSEALFRPVLTKLNKKDKPKLKISDVKNFFNIFIVSTIVRPGFDGQEKNKLEEGEITVTVKPSHITSIFKWNVMDDIDEMIKSKELVKMKSAERGRKKFKKIENLNDANNAGTRYGNKCKLVIAEGLSAKAFIIAGIEEGLCGVCGRDWIGVFPVKGKILNTRDATVKSITSNTIVTNIIQALGLSFGVDYTDDANFNKLRYGTLVLATDADVDGIHIEGLVLNLIQSLFPSLLCRDEPFIVSMKTPIARVKIPRKDDLVFYDERRYREYLDTHKNVNAKYYKGLATISPSDVSDIFGKKMVSYNQCEKSVEALCKAFRKKLTDVRKQWLSEYDSSIGISLDDQPPSSSMNIADFIDTELIKFSKSDCARSIPHIMDGFKESQRKGLFGVKKAGLTYKSKEMRVSQIGAEVSKVSKYHHGEASMFGTITNMAMSFVGSNNVPIFAREGMFGTRMEGGKDAGQPRYIETKMDMLTHLIYRDNDEPLLSSVIDDGDSVEPRFYVPIIPMILVNGCTVGIGTGWSCSVPCYNPIDVINSVREWLSFDGNVYDTDNDMEICVLTEIHPWYRGFTGEITKVSENKYTSYGRVEPGKTKGTYVVSELPIGMWTEKFKEKCDDMMEEKTIKDYKDYSSIKEPNFVITEVKDGVECSIQGLGLTKNISTNNMVLFDEYGTLKKYDSPERIIDHFCRVRYEYYKKRKQYLIPSIEKEVRILGNKERFIMEVIDETIEIRNVKKDKLMDILEKKGYDKIDDKYDYLLNMSMWSLTAEKVGKIRDDLKSAKTKLDTIKKTSEKDMWLAELEELEKKYYEWLIVVENEVITKKKKKGKK